MGGVGGGVFVVSVTMALGVSLLVPILISLAVVGVVGAACVVEDYDLVDAEYCQCATDLAGEPGPQLVCLRTKVFLQVSGPVDRLKLLIYFVQFNVFALALSLFTAISE